ncbi:maleate cis-trans isomerase family protein [Aestuariivita boseongensis]|uniref:maleate cis-trans isomerase family protein n=1 Tax=Aestuariivita boseongensis TaxID=1470562 RepID=UPI000682B00C|nr:hypothetical protein [Aestuariivita boseongensis]
MTAGLEYGAAGLMGVLTPQANTTVEPEFWALMPPGWSMLTARLMSDKPSIAERLVDYTERYSDTCLEFANAPVEVIAAACTGASYLIGRPAEEALVTRIEARFEVPFITAALASVMALRALGAEKIALLSPYPEDLNRASTPYWEAHGFSVVAKAGPMLEEGAFHPIYAMGGEAVYRSYAHLSDSGADAVLMLGTGMATLRPLLRGAAEGLLPAVSCNLAMAWAAAQRRRWEDLSPDDLEAWRMGAHWADRLEALFPTKA